MAADRGAFIDQSQSLNLFIESPTIGQLSSMYLLRLEAGPEDDLLPALAPGDAHRQDDASTRPRRRRADADAVACSLENPESCEACQ